MSGEHRERNPTLTSAGGAQFASVMAVRPSFME
jgi:hypothetical protein